MDHRYRDAQSIGDDTRAELAIALEDLKQALEELKEAHCAALGATLTEAEQADFEAFLRAVTLQSLVCTGWS